MICRSVYDFLDVSLETFPILIEGFNILAACGQVCGVMGFGYCFVWYSSWDWQYKACDLVFHRPVDSDVDIVFGRLYLSMVYICNRRTSMLSIVPWRVGINLDNPANMPFRHPSNSPRIFVFTPGIYFSISWDYHFWIRIIMWETSSNHGIVNIKRSEPWIKPSLVNLRHCSLASRGFFNIILS